MQGALIKKIENDTTLGLLETNVSTEELLESLDWSQRRLADFRSLQSEKKKKEWLGVRLLLKKIFKDQPFQLSHDEQGKPVLTEGAFNISISHSGKYIGVLINQNLPVGIDIQEFKSNIDKGTGLFMSEKELLESGWKLNTRVLHVYWGAKEAIYKLIGSKETNIKTDIYIFPFDYRSFGKIKGVYKQDKVIHLKYELSENYVLVYSV